jgi:hypothetical protein
MLYGFLIFMGICNIVVLFLGHKPSDLYQEFWEQQSWLGRILANLFYAPAWLISFVIYFISKNTLKCVFIVSHYILGMMIAAGLKFGFNLYTISGIILSAFLIIGLAFEIKRG